MSPEDHGFLIPTGNQQPALLPATPETQLSAHISADIYELFKNSRNELLPIEDSIEVLPNLWSPQCIAYSPDGKYLAVGCKSGQIRLLETVNYTVVRLLEGHELGVKFVCFSPDGKWLASRGGDNIIRLWDVVTGKLLRTSFAHDDLWVSSALGGYYTGSRNCEELLLFRNKKTGGIEPAYKHRAHFYKPEKVRLKTE